MVAQLMFGAWVSIVVPISGSSVRQERLRRDGLSSALVGAASGDGGRTKFGGQLERIRKLRNQVAHHNSLLGVEIDIASTTSWPFCE